jgi:superfamily II DNA or RNA helicase
VEFNPNFKPREWQINAVNLWVGKLSGIVSVVTGGGKTLFALMCIEKFKKIHPNKRVIILVPTLTLVDQWYLSLIEEMQVVPASIACFSSQEKSKKLLEFNLVLINTGRKILPPLKSKEDYILIVDECHRVGSPINSKAIKGNYGATLGLSATPKREYDDGFLRNIVPNLGNIIYEYDYKQALADKAICDFELQNVKIDLLPHEQRRYSAVNRKLKAAVTKHEETKSGEAIIKRLLIQRAQIISSAMMRIPVTAKLAEIYSKERVIIFHETIDGANEIMKILQQRKHAASLYHSGIPSVLRRDNLRLYQKGIYNILITCKALDEGMNVPETTVAIIASSTASTRQRIQRLGRVLRPAKGKTNATIITLYASEQERKRLIVEYNKFEQEVPVMWLKSDNDGKGINK